MGLALPNCPQFVVAYFAVLSIGGIVVNLNPLYTHDELKFLMENTGITGVGPGETGEIIIKGPTIMKEYWNSPEATAKDLRDGWLYTGDIAQADDDGYLSIVDRKKDMIIAEKNWPLTKCRPW